MRVEYTRLGTTGLAVSRVGLGTWVMGGTDWGGSDEADAIRAIHRAIDMGITLIDTAPVYGFGRSEEIVGRAVARKGGRDRLVLATKVGLEWDAAAGRVWRNSAPQRIRQEVEDSLRRLQTDYIDLYQVHWPDPKVPIEETAVELDRLKASGKVRAVGVSNYSVEQMETWRRVAPLDTDQPPYNLLEREIEADILPYCWENGIATLIYGVLCRGLLSGKFTPALTLGPGDIRARDPKFQGERFRQYLLAVDRLKAFAAERGKDVTQLAGRWALDKPEVTVALWGARNPQQIAPAAGVAGWSLTAQDVAAVEAIVAETVAEAVGPEFMAPPVS